MEANARHTPGGRYSPGASPGSALTTAFNVNSGGTFVFEIANATGAAGVRNGWDRLTVEQSASNPSPKANLTATSAAKFNIEILSLLNSGDYNTAGPADNFDPQQSYTWQFIDASDPAVTVSGGVDPSAFNIDTTGFANSIAGTFAVA